MGSLYKHAIKLGYLSQQNNIAMYSNPSTKSILNCFLLRFICARNGAESTKTFCIFITFL